MTDPNTPTTSTNPQDLIDQALGSATTSVSTPTDPTEPTLPTPEPLSPPPATEQMVEQQKPEAEPTDAVPEPTAMPEPPKDVKPMGDDMPLAFATATPADTMTTTPPEPYVEPVNTAVVPPILAAPSAPNTSSKGKGAMSKIKMAVVALLAVLGITGGVGLYAYQRYGTVEPATIAVISDKTAAECSGCSCTSPGCGGGWLKMVGGQCKVSGICNSAKDSKNTENPVIISDAQKYNSKDSCNTSGKGYVWCESIDSKGQAYSFCNTSGQGCNQAAIDKGYTIRVGVLKCIQVGNTWSLDRNYYNSNTGDGAQTADQVIAAYGGTDPCAKQYSATTGKEQYICKEGVKGEGNIVYSGGPCTALNGKKFTGNLNCFCGTVQVDTANGHESYSSTCGCDKPEATPTPSTPTVTVTPTLMCTGLTHTPTTTPVIGDKLTFTCAGSSTPAGAVNLTYKFRYNLNNGAYVSMTNKTATTSELTIASCGTYKVQCQACGTINGVLTCDPTWTTATQ